ncbi:MAG: hypothetical protein HYX24_07575 [Candidatus Aenigmarchaeota archaeon]|nr:hypothetical protein [Candidatus Aenigmarchaeota archaeon]
MEGHRIDRRLMKDAADFQKRHLIFEYHNVSHVLDALGSGVMYGRMEGIGEQEEKLLHTSLLLHEIGMIYGREGHEEMSACVAAFVLPHYCYSESEIREVCRVIRSSQDPANPGDLLEKLFLDADIDNLGRPDFWIRAESVRKEEHAKQGLDWLLHLKGLLSNHKYYTGSAGRLRSAGLKKNLHALDDVIEEYQRLYVFYS